MNKLFEWIVFGCICIILGALAAAFFLMFGSQPLR